MRIDHVALWTHDLERCTQFYSKYFGTKAGARYINQKKGFESCFLSFSDPDGIDEAAGCESAGASMAEQRFTAAIRIRGINPYIAISASRAKALKPGWRRPLPVLVRIGGIPRDPWRTNLMPTGGGGFYLYLHGQMRRDSNCAVGKRVEVQLRVDRHYTSGAMHPMPVWFHDRLNTSPTALRNWNSLVPSRQKEILRYFASLKSEAARVRNVDRAMRVLLGQRERFMARSWKDGR